MKKEKKYTSICYNLYKKEFDSRFGLEMHMEYALKLDRVLFVIYFKTDITNV